MNTKICKMCNSSYSLDEFYNKKAASDGKHIYCRTCMKQEKKQYYEQNKHIRSDYYKVYRDQNKDYFTNTVPTTTILKKSYTGNGIEQNTTPI
jgi:hypothetical protein